MNRIFFILSGLFIFFQTNIGAQVTIGAGIKPREGSLLDIKQDNTTGNNPNADGGIGLPRVQLLSFTELIVDVEPNKSNYVGLTVYNIGNENIPEGIYFWDGEKWVLSVSVDNVGKDGQLLKSNGNGTFGWSTFILPEYTYHKPTQISVFDDAKAIPQQYSYTALTGGGNGIYGGVKPRAGTFDNSFLYSENLNIKTEASKEKYILLGVSGLIEMATIQNYTPYKGFWQIIQIDVLVDGIHVQSNQRLYSTAAQGDKKIYVDMFSIVPLDQFGKGVHEMKIKISNVENTFPNNLGSNDGNFSSSNTKFYMITLQDINLVLYEND